MSHSGPVDAATPHIAVAPFFLDTAGGRIFAVHHAPPDAHGHVLCVPGFNEEMNRCRSMLTLQARALAAAGLGTLLIDLHGTGDSEGDFVDGRWDRWQDNIGAAAAWLDARGGCVALLGVRLGVMIASEWMHAHPDGGRALVAWQPVADGKQYLTQFLRMRIAANMDRTDIPKETTSSMREQMAQGVPVEVGGYEIHPQLAQAIDARQLATLAPPGGTRVAWLEQRTPASDVPSPAGERVIAAWRAAQVAVDVIPFEGQAFWQLHERSLALDAIDATAGWVRKACGRP